MADLDVQYSHPHTAEAAEHRDVQAELPERIARRRNREPQTPGASGTAPRHSLPLHSPTSSRWSNRAQAAIVTIAMGQPSSLTNAFSYIKPDVTSAVVLALLPYVPESGLLQLYGDRFGLVDYSFHISIGTADCKTSLWTSDSSMSCQLYEAYSPTGVATRAASGCRALVRSAEQGLSEISRAEQKWGKPRLPPQEPETAMLHYLARLRKCVWTGSGSTVFEHSRANQELHLRH